MFSGPPELQDAIKDNFSYDVLPSCGVYKLLKLASDGYGDYTWGYRIYRTTYNRPDSDSRFAKAIAVLNDYIRYECFSYRDDGRQKGTIPMPPLDSNVNDQLWQRLRHDVIEDRALLEGASETPGTILKLAQDWVHLDQKAKTGDSPRYRFFLVFDDEVIDHLLQLPAPENRKKNIPFVYSVKVYDARFDSPPEWSGGESDSDSDACSEGFEFDKDFEGWFWTSARRLAELWFCDYDLPWEELLQVDDSWDGKRRFVPSNVARNYLPLPERFKELVQADLQQRGLDQ